MDKQSLIPRNSEDMALGGGLEGAKTMTREMLRWQPSGGSPDALINPSKKLADDRSRNLVQNDGYLSGVLHTNRDSIVGAAYMLNSQPNIDVLSTIDARFTPEWAAEFQAAAEARFNLVAESRACWLDAAGRNTLTDQVRLAVGVHVYTGEVLAAAEWIGDVGRPFKTAMQMIAPDRLCNPDNGPDTQFLRRGVEIDSRGRPIAYHIRNGYPGDIWNTMEQVTWRRIEARKPWGRRQMIHIMEQDSPGQSRAVSEMVAALKQMHMTRRFQDITLQNAVINASYAATMESELPMEMLNPAMGGNQLVDMAGEYLTSLQAYMLGSNNLTVDGAQIPVLFPNSKLKMQPMGTPGGVGTVFEQSLLRHIAASLGLSYEEFARDFSKTNYSSARASMSGTNKRMSAKKKAVADRYASHVYDLWMEEDIAQGGLPLPPGVTRAIFYQPLVKEAITQCSWIGAGRGQIDEVKETQAALMRIAGGLSTYEIESARLGQYFRDVVRQRQREEEMIKKAGLNFSTNATKPGTNDRQQTMNGTDADKEETQDEQETE